MTYASLRADFRIPSGKIDFITLRVPFGISTLEDFFSRFEAIIGEAAVKKIYVPEKDKTRFTLHDPSNQELQNLINAYPKLEILALEISLDFALKDGSNNALKLQTLRRWLVPRLHPSKHECLKKRSWRKYYDEESQNILRDSKRGKGLNTVYWGSDAGHEQVRLYIKTLDNKIPVRIHTVRLEVTMLRGGCQNAYVNRLAMLPSFINNMRKYLSRFFSIGKSIKPINKRATRSKDPVFLETINLEKKMVERKLSQVWERNGARWVAETLWIRNKTKWAEGREFNIEADTDANRWVEQGLKKLRTNLSKLTIPESVAEKVAEWRKAYEVKTP